MIKKISILGSTGQIGSQALEVIRSYKNEFQVIGLACGHWSEKFRKQMKEFKPKVSAVAQDGEDKVIEVATHPEVDLVIVAVVGMAGLKSTLAAIKAHKDIALATKEVLVIAGGIVIKEVLKQKVKFLPLDSEHSAIFQCLQSASRKEIKRIILTMGKGKISQMSLKQLKEVKLNDILNRSTWRMGEKIAIDSATCINKAFEVTEAAWLFSLKPEQIEIVVHPEYICHSLVEFVDGSIITELGTPDMKRYIQYALFYPKRKPTRVSSYIDIVGKNLSFEKPPFDKFPCLSLGYDALKAGGTMPAVLHGADESAVKAFIKGKISFTDIHKIIIKTMKVHRPIKRPSLRQVIMAEQWAQEKANEFLKEER